MSPHPCFRFAAVATLAAAFNSVVAAEISFTRLQLDRQFFAEGVAIADFNNDGHPDVAAGPYWYEGPDFTKRHEIKAPLAYDPESYSDAFITYAYDVDHDGWTDIVQVGWPGREAVWYKNPGTAGGDWSRHVLFPSVGTESPTLVDLFGDGKRELILAAEKRIGWAAPDPADPYAPWKFHPISPEGKWERYTHGVGVGDVRGNGHSDILTATGWFEPPASLAGDPLWKFHAVDFGPGGAQMYVYDVNGDGRPDVITSIKAHGYGISWFEQLAPVGGEPSWREHPITSRDPSVKIQGVQFSQPHAMILADIAGDGLQDIVTGKRHWAHGSARDPEPNAPAVLYWFHLVRAKEGPHYEAHLIDDQSGVGTQIAAGDLNGDGYCDIAVSNKNGVFIFFQHRKE